MPEWKKIDLPTETASRSNDLSAESNADISRERERPIAVTAVAAYQWLKAALFAQLFWNLWSSHHSSDASAAVTLSSGTGQNHAVFLLLAVALYLVVLGCGLWSLQKWALLLLLLTWLPDLGYDFSPELFGLEHTADLWLGDQAALLLLGITIVDTIAVFVFTNRRVYRAFDAESETNLLEILGRVLFWWT